jgi:hypothetical protein
MNRRALLKFIASDFVPESSFAFETLIART